MSKDKMENTTNKVNSIFQIVRLKEIVQKWHQNTVSQKESKGSTSSVKRHLRNLSISWDSDEESCTSLEIPSDVPRGHIPVYVGHENRRFVIPASYLSSPVFKLLLEKAEEEFGFSHKGALSIPCDVETFKYILQVMDQHQKGLIDHAFSTLVETKAGVNHMLWTFRSEIERFKEQNYHPGSDDRSAIYPSKHKYRSENASFVESVQIVQLVEYSSKINKMKHNDHRLEEKLISRFLESNAS